MAQQAPAALDRFKKAMRSVYGRFDELAPEKDGAIRWTPPDNPGAGGHRGRYLWTDAFGVLNFVTLFRETSSAVYLQLARQLVATVHDVLGRERDGSSRLPGATDAEPLRGGLRIGKLDAGGADGDGQYHHYLTLWMFALNRLSLAARDPSYNALAVQLAEAIHPHFMVPVAHGRGTTRMVWKISTDMHRVLVPSEGHLDAATGFVVYRLLQQTAAAFSQGGEGGVPPPLQDEIGDYGRIMGQEGKLGVSSDSLDLGMSLWMCHFFRDEDWAARLGAAGLREARTVLRRVSLREASHRERLAFREFGLCLGIECYGSDGELQSAVAELVRFWEAYVEQQDEDLRPISQVMYAAAVIPGAFRDGYLTPGQ